MKSKASFKSHPIHPILVNFPIAFFVGAFIFDCIGLIADIIPLNTAAYYMSIAGCVGAVAAAIFGFYDYLETVPPDSSAKKRATKHGILNVTVLLLFVAAILLRLNLIDLSYTLIIELIAVILLSIAGFLGGTLVYRNQIGVDPRYAWAGKWKEIIVDQRSGTFEVDEELNTNQMMLIRLKNKRIVLGRTDKSYVAFDDHCTHRGGSLAGGALICDTVQCPWHGSQFNVNTGEVSAGPAKQKINTYKVEAAGGKIIITV
jgi:uncharacterized membrane protein/nitrite reductase/ring-hydroxylating ferredoxin subunit